MRTSMDMAGAPRSAFAMPNGDQVAGDWDRERLLALLRRIAATGYDFVAPTPASHARVVGRRSRETARDLADVLGWSRPTEPGVVEPSLETDLLDAGVLARTADGRYVPRLRASRVDDCLFWHSAYPTDAQDAVFLGPDSHRFAQFIRANMPGGCRTILDYGAGAGVGGIIAARRTAGAMLTIADINPKALFLASINAEHAGIAHETIHVAHIGEIADQFDLVVTHPPFMIDRERRAYRDGGSLYGAKLSHDWCVAGAARLAPRGRLVMHTGASIVNGQDVLHAALRQKFPQSALSFEYRELDTDIFGDELDNPAYSEVDRIAAVGVIVERTAV